MEPATLRPTPGGAPFSRDVLLRALTLVHDARALHNGAERLFRAGGIPFFLGLAGHEVAQVAAALALRPGADWFFPYYRDSAFVLALGHTVEDHLLSLLAGSDDPGSGGRQGPNHWGLPELNVVAQSSCAGTQFLHAAGAAEVLARTAPGAIAYVSSGEGTTSQGEFHEAVNWAALRRLPVVFFIQDNGFAISTPTSEQTAGGSIGANLSGVAGLEVHQVDGTDFFATAEAMRTAAARARAGRGPSLVHVRVPRLGSHSSADDQARYRAPAEVAAEARRDPIPRFEAALVQAGVVTAEEVERSRADAEARFRQALARARSGEPHDPATVSAHVYGLSHAAGGGGIPEPAEGSGAPVRMLDAIQATLDEEMARDPRVVVFGEDVASAQGGVFGATRGLREKHGSGRVFNTPLAEAAIVGVGVGMAMAGWRPVVEMQFADYIFPAMMQIRSEMAMLRYRSRGRWSCPLVIRAASGGYIGGGHYHSQSIEGFFTHIAGLRVVCPSNAADARGMLKAALRGDDPVLFLEPKALYRAAGAARPDAEGDGVVPLGRAAVRRSGEDATVITWGTLVHRAMDAAETLAAEGIHVEVLDLRSLNPLDEEAIFASVRRTGRALVAYESQLTGGFGAEVAARIADRCFHDLRAPVRRVAALDSPVPCAPELEAVMLPQTADLVAALRALAAEAR
jgi:2-oxoisovalerate dehydrogenase E1 component